MGLARTFTCTCTGDETGCKNGFDLGGDLTIAQNDASDWIDNKITRSGTVTPVTGDKGKKAVTCGVGAQTVSTTATVIECKDENLFGNCEV